MIGQDQPVIAQLTSQQLDRLRYVAACGPVLRVNEDLDLERLQLLQSYNGMKAVVEVTSISTKCAAVVQSLMSAAPALLAACKITMREFAQSDWCDHGYGCGHCSGCSRYETVRSAVAKAERGSATSDAQHHNSVSPQKYSTHVA